MLLINFNLKLRTFCLANFSSDILKSSSQAIGKSSQNNAEIPEQNNDHIKSFTKTFFLLPELNN